MFRAHDNDIAHMEERKADDLLLERLSSLPQSPTVRLARFTFSAKEALEDFLQLPQIEHDEL